MASCYNTDDVVDVYEQAIEDVQNCKTGAEIQDLTYRVREQQIEISNRLGGDRKLSPEESERIFQAEERYKRAVEYRASQVPNY